MKEKVEERLRELRNELESGRTLLDEIETKKANLQSTLLRISGAIQVLEELLASETTSDARAKAPPIS
jgi:predicted  nucleic acid-binding Zn-ribbon protein